MGLFKENGEDNSKLDFEILYRGGGYLYFKENILNEDIEWFRGENYDIIDFQCKPWQEDFKLLCHEIRSKLKLEGFYSDNFNSLNDALCNFNFSDNGIVLVFRDLDSLDEKTYNTILDIFMIYSRRYLLFGKKIIVLAKIDNNNTIALSGYGAVSLIWNGKEHFKSQRM